MRIGELAALVGVTSRTVRHYHQQGLLPEPVRRANGYREYGLRDAVVLARIRRLTELGLGLAEVRDVLADDAGRELVEVLEELDADLAAQEAAIARRRARLGELVAQARDGRLPVEGPVSAELAGLLGALGPTDSPMAAKDREHLALLDSLVPDEQRAELFAVLGPLAGDEGYAARAQALYERLDELADAAADDPRVEPLAVALADAVPDALLAFMDEGEQGDGAFEGAFGEAFLADFAPAQAAVVRRMLVLVKERTAGGRAAESGDRGEQGAGR
ncbi:MerR family transcriptional regulator [Streptomyces sp. NPDC005805]|uniref:MerR family transcriptional regulator n=1 Tax=Streptomyces sp. NPDC005805 TaxID=3157068 RepID=UPI0033F2C67E